MNHYEILLISAAGREMRNIIAESALRATQIALDTAPELVEQQFAIICKPGVLAMEPGN